MYYNIIRIFIWIIVLIIDLYFNDNVLDNFLVGVR